jgi:type IV pilus assembly protein PilO
MSRKRLYTLVVLIVIIALFAYVYFALYRPVAFNIKTSNQQLQSEEELIAVLEQQAGTTVSGPTVATGMLQNKVPVKPMSDKLMLDFEKAELLSRSLITTIVFTEGEEEILPETLEEDMAQLEKTGTAADPENADETDQAEESTDENVTDATEEETEPAEQPLPEEVLPAGIRKIRAQMTVESPGYAEMDTFIETLENQMRMLKVEQLEFTGPEEAQKLAGEVGIISYNITVAAYYMPELIDLLEDSPEIDTPDPAGKEDPFVTIDE